MNVFVTGTNGLIGRELVPLLEAAGHQVTRLVRGVPQNSQERSWETGGRRMDPGVLRGCEALIHLAGESLANGRWTQHKKDLIFCSRADTTAILADAMTRMSAPPKTFIVASAVGYYGNSGDEILSENSSAGEGFLADVCRAWESAAAPVRDMMRVAHIRTGMVLSRKGGALRTMLYPFKMGLGGVIGNGQQYWSWITLQDIARLFAFALENESVRGPVNGVSPNPVTNMEFTKTLGELLKKPTFCRVPAFAARLALGEMADELLLASTRVVPVAATAYGFQFNDSELRNALAKNV